MPAAEAVDGGGQVLEAEEHEEMLSAAETAADEEQNRWKM
jgi:hypothetical protein